MGQPPGQHPEMNTRDSKNTKFLVKSGKLEFDEQQVHISPAGELLWAHQKRSSTLCTPSEQPANKLLRGEQLLGSLLGKTLKLVVWGTQAPLPEMLLIFRNPPRLSDRDATLGSPST